MAQHLVFPASLRISLIAFITLPKLLHTAQISHVSTEETTKYFLTNSLGVSKLIDLNTATIAYKDHVEKSCYLEKMTTTSAWEKSKMLIIYPRLLTIQQVQTFAGPTVSAFCFGWPSRILQQTNNLEMRRKRSDPEMIPRKIRGQTQSQYLHYGKSESEGKAEAESHSLGSKASVYGSNGMGQAQSQSGPFSCTDCYNQFGQTMRTGASLQSQDGRPATSSISSPGQVHSQSGGVKQDAVGAGPGQLITSGGPTTFSGTPGFSQGGTLGITGDQTIPSQQNIVQPGQRTSQIQIPGVHEGFSGTGQQQGGISGPTNIYTHPQGGSYVPGEIRTTLHPGIPSGQRVSSIQTPGSVGISQNVPGQTGGITRPPQIYSQAPTQGTVGTYTPGVIQTPGLRGPQVGFIATGEGTPGIAGPSQISTQPHTQTRGGSFIPGVIQTSLLPGVSEDQRVHQVPGLHGAQDGFTVTGQQIPGQIGGVTAPSQIYTQTPTGVNYMPGGTQTTLQSSDSGGLRVSMQTPGLHGVQQGSIEMGQGLPGQFGGTTGPSQVYTQTPSQSTDGSFIQGPMQSTLQPGITERLPGQPGLTTYYIPGKSQQPEQQVTIPGQVTLTHGRGYIQNGDKTTKQDKTDQISFQGAANAKGTFAGQLSGQYESPVGQSGRFSGSFQGNYAGDRITVGRYEGSLPGQQQTGLDAGTDVTGRGSYVQPVNIQQYPREGSRQTTLSGQREQAQITQGGQGAHSPQYGQVEQAGQVGQVGQNVRTGTTSVPGYIIGDGGTKLYPQQPGQISQTGQFVFQHPSQMTPSESKAQLQPQEQQYYQRPSPGTTGSQVQILPGGQGYQIPGTGGSTGSILYPGQSQLPFGSQTSWSPGSQEIYQRPGTGLSHAQLPSIRHGQNLPDGQIYQGPSTGITTGIPAQPGQVQVTPGGQQFYQGPGPAITTGITTQPSQGQVIPGYQQIYQTPGTGLTTGITSQSGQGQVVSGGPQIYQGPGTGITTGTTTQGGLVHVTPGGQQMYEGTGTGITTSIPAQPGQVQVTPEGQQFYQGPGPAISTGIIPTQPSQGHVIPGYQQISQPGAGLTTGITSQPGQGQIVPGGPQIYQRPGTGITTGTTTQGGQVQVTPGGQQIYEGTGAGITTGITTQPGQGQILPSGQQIYQMPGAGLTTGLTTRPGQGQVTPGWQQIYQGPGAGTTTQTGQGQVIPVGQEIYQGPATGIVTPPGQGHIIPGGQQIYQGPLTGTSAGSITPPMHSQIPSGQYPSGPFQEQGLGSPGFIQRQGSIPGQPSGQSLPDDANSEAQTSVHRINNETQASASSSGRFAGGTAQSQVAGSYSGEGSFSASAGSNDGLRGAQTQISGNSAGTLSSSQGNGGKSKTQAQVQLNADTGDTTAGAQTGGLNHGTNSQVQSGIKGGLADAQANGPGRTSSQAQIGFIPYNAESDQEDPRNPHNGGASASAGSGTHAGKSQVQISGKYAFGIKYTGQAQASSANSGFNAQEISLPTMKPIDFDLHINSAVKKEEKLTSVRQVTDSKVSSSTEPPSLDTDLKNTDYDDEYDDLEDEEDTDAKNLLEQQHARSVQGDMLDPVEDLERGEVINSEMHLKHGEIIQPGHFIPGSNRVKIPMGFRGRISEDTIPAANVRNVIYAAGVKTNRMKSKDIGYGSGYSYQPSYAPVQYGFKSSKPKFVSVTKSETGSRNVITGKKTPSVYYTQSSTCGFFTNTCFYSNGKKVCLPRPKANADGTPMLCKN